MKNNLKRWFSGLLASAILVTGCSTQAPTVNQAASQVNTSSVVTADVYREKSVRVNIEKAALYGDKVQVSSSFAQFSAKSSDLLKDSQPITINALSPQLITLFDQDAKNPLALSVIPNPQRASTVLISPQSTAEALIFMDPAIATTEVNVADQIMSIIKAQPETKELARVIESRVQNHPDFLNKDSQEQDDAITKAVNAVVNKLADEYENAMKAKANDNPNRVEGVEINVVDQQDLVAHIELKNYLKRSADLYFDGDHNGTAYPMYKESLQSAYDYIDFSHVSFGRKPYVATVGYDIQRPMTQVEVIGLGLKDIKDFKAKWPSLSQADKMKYGMPIVSSFMSDFVSPVISIIVGFNINKVYKVGLFKIITGLPITQIVELFKEKQYGKAFKLILSTTVQNLLEKNGALLREILLAAGLNLTDAILSKINAICGIVNLIRYGVEAARALYAYATTNIVDAFKVDYSAGKLQFLKNDAKSLSVARTH